ncbi:MAG: ABC transporter ATP-binding protein [bacterium]|nr:ABC transporter ATP-binding protein [bacterium]
MTPKLFIRHLSHSYHSKKGETAALSDISFSVDSGEFVAIVGPSGCGKSTLLSLICGLSSPDEGEIFIDGIPRSQYKTPIGYMLQKDHLLEWRSILSNALLGPEISHCITPAKREYVLSLLHNYGLGNFLSSKPSELSGGMRQRAALVRTLAMEPELLLLDEPFSALDYQTRLQVCDDISEIIREQKKTALLITHDLAEAVSIADRIIVLSKRPASIKKILPIRFSEAYNTPLQKRNAPEFPVYFQMVWEQLCEPSEKTGEQNKGTNNW